MGALEVIELDRDDEDATKDVDDRLLSAFSNPSTFIVSFVVLELTSIRKLSADAG